MRITSFILSAALFSSSLAATAFAQSPGERPHWTFGGTIGQGRTWDDEGSIGSGWMVGGYTTRRISRNVDAELAVDSQTHDRESEFASSFEAHGRTIYMSVSVIRRFGIAAANCFVFGGGVIGIHWGTIGFADDPVRVNTDSTHGGLIFGGGLSFRPAGGVEIGPVVKITLMGVDRDSDPLSSFMAGVKIGIGR